ncbi:hypothetical protein L7F22_022932 [Adiantum nelumboides]|nr:hypothetical protein [Adiantum nelumboides]
MAVQKKAWMTGELFQAWLQYFDNAITQQGKDNRHLLILDGHGSHVSLEVVAKAKEAGIDIVTLPAHTSHKLQPLDVSVFKPLKVQFQKERDKWQQRTASKQASKTELASIVATSISLSLTEANITTGFHAIGIWPLDFTAIKFEGMPCNHINFVEDTSTLDETESQAPSIPMEQTLENYLVEDTTAFEETESQVPSSPMEHTLEDEVEAILALNTLSSQLQEENRISSQQGNTSRAISFTQLLERGKISDYTTCEPEPHFFMEEQGNWDVTTPQNNTNFIKNQVSSPIQSIQPQRAQEAWFPSENVAPRSTSQEGKSQNNHIIDKFQESVIADHQQARFPNENAAPTSSTQEDTTLQKHIIDMLRVPMSEVCVRQVNREAFVDNTNSLILTSTQYIDSMRAKNAKKTEIAKAKEEKRIEKEKKRLHSFAEQEAAQQKKAHVREA